MIQSYPRLAVVLALVAASGLARADDQATPAASKRVESLARTDGERLAGQMIFAPALGFGFKPEGAGKAVRLDPGHVVTFDGPGLDPAAGFPPFRIEFGLGQRISGRLARIDATTVRFAEGPGGSPISVARPGAAAVVQRPGEVQVLQDGFESLDETRWSSNGDPEIVPEPRLAGEHALRVPSGGTSLTCRLAESIGAGRLDLAYFDDGAVVAGHQCFIDMAFRGPKGQETVRAILGWAEESLGVESVAGPALAVQHLTRKRGWHRLSVRYGPDQTQVAVDGNELAHGRGPGGPLVEIRLASHVMGKDAAPGNLAGHFDDLRIARLTEPAGSFEVDPKQDELRLVDGDQVFGALKSADRDRIVLAVLEKDVTLSWGEVAGLYFRRASAPGEPIEGLLVRLEWRASPGGDPADLDQMEGALRGLTDSTVALATPYAGVLTIPRDRLKRLSVAGRGRRLVIDPSAHHLGNNLSINPPILDPPQPEGGVLERTIELAALPPGAAALTLDVVQVIGEASASSFADEVKKGELRTNVKINGTMIDYLNRHVTSKNETPERIRLAIPPGLLRAGKNQLRIEQTGQAGDPGEFDDLGVLGLALEFETDRAAGAGPVPEKP